VCDVLNESYIHTEIFIFVYEAQIYIKFTKKGTNSLMFQHNNKKNTSNICV